MTAPSRLTRAPREEQVILRDLDALDREITDLEVLAVRADTARDAINERLPSMERAFHYGEPYTTPSGNVIELRNAHGILAYRTLLDVLNGNGELTDDFVGSLNSIVAPRPDAPMVRPPHYAAAISRDETARAWRECVEASAKIEALYARQGDLLDELTARQAGPGERKPYHLIGGGLYGRFEDGVSKTYRPHPERPPVVMLDDWEAVRHGANAVPVEAPGPQSRA